MSVIFISRPSGSDDTAQWRIVVGDAPQAISGLTAGMYEVAKGNLSSWSSPLAVGDAVDGVELVGYTVFAKGISDPDTSGTTGSPILVTIPAEAEDGDMIVVAGYTKNSSALILLPPEPPANPQNEWNDAGFTQANRVFSSQAESNTTYNSTFGAMWAIKTGAMPAQIGRMLRFNEGVGVVLALRRVPNPMSPTLAIDRAESTNIATLPEVSGVTPGSLSINITNITNASRAVSPEPADLEFLTNADPAVTGTTHSTSISWEIAGGATLPERELSIPGAASPHARGVRIVIPLEV